MSGENSDDDAFESADEDDLIPCRDESDETQYKSDECHEENVGSQVKDSKKRIINVSKSKDTNVAPICGGAGAAISSDSPSSTSETPAISDVSSTVSGALAASPISNASEAAATAPVAAVAAPAAEDSWSVWGDWGSNAAAAAPSELASASVAAEDSWSSWGNWGASILSTASKSVSQFSTEVTEGLNVLVDVSTSDVEDQEQDEAAEKAAQQVKEDVIESQPAVDIPALSTGQLPPDDPRCPLSDPPISSSSSTAASSTLSSFTSGFFSSASSFDTASAAAGLSSVFGSLTQRNLPTLSSFSSALSSSSAAAEGSSSSSSVLTTPSVAGEKLAGLMDGGLGVLEMVGRKTMDILKESDGGLEVTRAIFHDRRGKPTLSDLLKEGKTKSEVEDGKKEEVLEERKKSFQFWFDEYKGMAHLEALELLNNCCETDIKELLKENHDDSLKPALINIKNIFVKDDNDDEDEVLSFTEEEEEVLRQMMRKHAEQFGPESATKSPVDIFVDAVKEAWGRVEEMEKMIEADEGGGDADADAGSEGQDQRNASSTTITADPSSVHRACIENLANMVAKSVGLFHKIGQMTLVPITDEAASSSVDEFAERLSHLLFLSKLLTANIDGAATAFGQLLSKFEGRRSEIEINQVMTDIFLEASQGTSHVRSAFKLLLPVMQVRFLKESEKD